MYIRSLPAAMLMLTVSFAPALADRSPNATELSEINSKLQSLGYVSWKEIELDDGKWEIDDAKRADGTEYDVELQPGSLAVIKQDRED